MKKNKHTKKSLLPDKRNAPKKSGPSRDRMAGKPLDPAEDFDKPTHKDPLEELDKMKEPKGSLLVEQPPKKTVVGDRMEVFYLKPVFGKTKEGDITVSMVITMTVEEAHSELLPEIIHAGYKDILKKGRSSINFRDLPAQAAEFYLSPDAKESQLELPAAKMLNATLALVERKGEGQSRKVIRLTFRLQVKLSTDVARFAEHNLQNNFWLHIEETEAALFDEEEED